VIPVRFTLRVFSLTVSATVGWAAAVAAQQSPRDAMLVSPAWLAQHRADANLVLLHVGDEKEYEQKHIPGARFVRLQDVSVSDRSETGLVLEMPKTDSLRSLLERLGISDNSRIVVYYGNDWVSPTTRVAFTLEYAGLGSRTAVLDGGMLAWVSAGNPTTNVVPAARTGKLSPLQLKPLVVTADYVKSHIGSPGIAIVDARSGGFYDGLSDREMQHPGRHGHIAGAKSIPFDSVFDDKNVLKPAAALREIFSKAGVQPSDTVVGYCHIGQQATAMLFAARSIGHPVLLYDGSFTEWSRLSDAYPVVDPSAKKP